MITMCPFQFLEGDKCPLVGHAGKREGYACVGQCVWGKSVPAAHFCYESNIALKKSQKKKCDSNALFSCVVKERNTAAQLCRGSWGCGAGREAASGFCVRQPQGGAERGGRPGPGRWQHLVRYILLIFLHSLDVGEARGGFHDLASVPGSAQDSCTGP